MIMQPAAGSRPASRLTRWLLSGQPAVSEGSYEREDQHQALVSVAVITLVFLYTTAVNVVERPDGLRMAAFFVAAIVVTSLVSCGFRPTALRITRVTPDAMVRRLIDEATRRDAIRIIANRPDARDSRDYLLNEREEREHRHVPPGEPVVCFAVTDCDASEVATDLPVKGAEVGGHRVLRAERASIPNANVAFLLDVRDTTGTIPHACSGLAEGDPVRYMARPLRFGEGDIAPVTRAILRKAEPDPRRHPPVRVG
jgi:hypothetical protein